MRRVPLAFGSEHAIADSWPVRIRREAASKDSADTIGRAPVLRQAHEFH